MVPPFLPSYKNTARSLVWAVSLRKIGSPLLIFIMFPLYTVASLIIDTEEAEIKTVFQDDQEITILVKGSERQILGIIPDTTYRYIITGTLSEEEMLKIAKSIKAEEEE